MTLPAPHDRMDAGHQFVLVERLGHIIVRAETECSYLVFKSSQSRQDEDRRLDL